MDIDDDVLQTARAELGTATIKDTVNEALRRAGANRGETLAAALDTLAAADLADRGRRMAVTALLDTSVLTRLGDPAVRSAVADLAAGQSIARAAITYLEIGFSARNASEWDRLLGALETFDVIELDAHHVHRAREV